MTPEGYQKLAELFDAARKLQGEARARFLDGACGGDSALRAQVEVMLAAEGQMGSFLESKEIEQARQLLDPALTGSLAGQQFSHFQVLDKLGAGGMGEVWRARDLKLNREVAIKLLPGEFAQMPDRIRRFEQEARAASALNHPNIITIFEIGEATLHQERAYFMATELVEGRTLRAQLKAEPPTIGAVLDLTIQMVSALAAAHEAGIIHRDMKPDNVMVRRDGLVKVLDFGLAKLTEDRKSGFSSGRVAATSAPTLPLTPETAPPSTEPGAVMGTPQYMSPEQARGQSIDARTDIFSLGVILYEMLAGTPPFEGVNALDVISAILRSEPPALTKYLPEIPHELERLVEKTLRKDREQRYQSAKDLLIDLKDLRRDLEFQAEFERKVRSGSNSLANLSNPSQPAQLAAMTAAPVAAVTAETPIHQTKTIEIMEGQVKRQKRVVTAMGVFVVLLLGALGWGLWRMLRKPDVIDISALRKVELAKWRSAPSEDYVTGSFSPEGKWIAYSSTQGGSPNIWFKLAAAGEAKPVTSDQFTNLNPVWSPNGDELAFYSQRAGQNGLWRVPASGGTAKLIKVLAVNEPVARLRFWSKNDVLYYETNRQLWGLDLKSGQVQPVARLDNTKAIANTICLSQDEKQVAWASTGDPEEKGVWMRSVPDGTPRRISPPNLQARNTLWHPDNERVLFSGNVDGTYQVFIGYANGQPAKQLTVGDTNNFVLDISADGTRVLLGTAKEESDLWRVNVTSRQEVPVANDLSAEIWPAISADGQNVVWQTIKNLSQGDKLVNSQLLLRTGLSEPQPLDVPEGFMPQWSPDGKSIAFMRRVTDYGLWVMSATGGAARKLSTGAADYSGASMMPYNRLQTADFSWAPNGKQLVYGSVRQSVSNLWLVQADGAGETQLTTNSDTVVSLRSPLWATDGEKLAFTTTTYKRKADDKLKYSLELISTATRQQKWLFQSENFFRLIGWLPGEQELLIAGLKQPTGIAAPTDVELSVVSVADGTQKPWITLPLTYLYNIQLSADRKTVAFAAHRNDKDDLWLLPFKSADARKLTENSDPRLYLSGLAWSPDGQAIYFSKQLRHSMLMMLTGLPGSR